MILKDELMKFVNVFGREGHDIGNVNLNNDDNSGLEESLDLFYHFLRFEKVLTIGGELFINIIPYKDLSKAQDGWYKIKVSDQWENDDKNWNKEWVVFADRNDDAIYYNNLDNGIYGSIDKKINYKISNSLSQFISILTLGMHLEQEKYNFETSEDYEETSEEFLQDIYNILNDIDSSSADNFMAFFFE